MVLCGSLFACFGGGPHNEPAVKPASTLLVEAHGDLDSKDLKKPSNAPSTPEKHPPSKASDADRSSTQNVHEDGQRSCKSQEDTLRFVLDQARRLLQDASADAAVPLKAGGSKKQAVKEQQNARREEPALEQQEREAVALRDLLQALTNEYRPGPDIYVRTQEQLHAARKWLQSSPNPHQAASTFVRVASDTLMCVEASIKDAGQVTFWTPDVVSAFLELLRLHAALANCASLEASPSSQGSRAQRSSSKALLSKVAQMLLGRQELLGLVSQVLELLHFSEGYRRTWGVQQSTASALVLWDLLHKLVRFAAAMMPTSELMDSKAGACAADAVSSDPAALAAAAATAAAGGAAATAAGAEAGMDAPGNASTAAAQIAVGTGARGAAGSMSPSISTSYSSPSNAGPPISRSAMKSLAALLAPGKGTAARLLAQPFERGGACGAAGQLAALRLFKQVVRSAWGAQLLETSSMAAHYVGQHQARFVHYYARAEGDARTASAELCRMHLKVLDALVCTGSAKVRVALLHSRVAAALLQEFSLEAGLLSLEQQAQEEQEVEAQARAKVIQAQSEQIAEEGMQRGGSAVPAAATAAGERAAGVAGAVSCSEDSSSCSSSSYSDSSCSGSGAEDGDGGEAGGRERVNRGDDRASDGFAAGRGGRKHERGARRGLQFAEEGGEGQEGPQSTKATAQERGVPVIKALQLSTRPVGGAADGSNGSSSQGRGGGVKVGVPLFVAPYKGEGERSGDEVGVEEEHRNEDGGGKASAQEEGAPVPFAFTYDLEEDFERLMALEDALGRPVELDGFEYDEEAKALMARGFLSSAPPPDAMFPPIPEAPAIEAEEEAGNWRSRVPSKASKPLAPELSVAATAAAHGTAFVRAVPALNIKVSKEKGVQYANDQTSQDLGTHIYPSLPPSSLSDSPPLILTPCLHPPDPSHTPYLSTATHTTQSPSLSQPAHSPALSTQQTGQPAHSPAVSSQISPGGVHMSPSSQAGWVGGEAPQGHHHRHTHHTPVSPPHPLSHHLSSSANLYDPSDQRQQLHQNAAPSSPLPAQLASPQAPVQLQGGQPAANAALGVTPLKMGKGSYSRWEGSQHEGTEGASSDDEKASSVGGSLSHCGREGEAGHALQHVSFEQASPSHHAASAAAGHLAGDWEDLRRPSVPKLSFRGLRVLNASRVFAPSANSHGGTPVASRAPSARNTHHNGSFSRVGSSHAGIDLYGGNSKVASPARGGMEQQRSSKGLRGQASLESSRATGAGTSGSRGSNVHQAPTHGSSSNSEQVPSDTGAQLHSPHSSRLHHSHVSPLSARDAPSSSQIMSRPPPQNQRGLSRMHDSHGSHDAASTTHATCTHMSSSIFQSPAAAAPLSQGTPAGLSKTDTMGSARGGSCSNMVSVTSAHIAHPTVSTANAAGYLPNERRISMPPQLPPLPLSARSNRGGVDGLPAKLKGVARPGAALQQLSARSAMAPLSPLGSPQVSSSCSTKRPDMPKVPCLNLERAVASSQPRHGSSSRSGIRTPSGKEPGHRGAGTDSSRVIALAAAGLPPEVGGNSNSSSRTRGCAVGGDSLMEGRSSLVSNKRSGNSLANRGSSISCGGGSTDEEEEEGSDEDAPPGSYRGQVTRKLWFNDTALHSAMLELLLRLLVTPQGGLDTAYIQAVPMLSDARLPAVEHLLSWHFAGPPGSAILGEVAHSLASSLAHVQEVGSGSLNSSKGGGKGNHTSNRQKAGTASVAAAAAAAAAAATCSGAGAGNAGAGNAGAGAGAGAYAAGACAAGAASSSNSSNSTMSQAQQLNSMLLLLRLLTRQSIDCSRFRDLQFHSRGAYGNIYRALRLIGGESGVLGTEQAEPVMVKVIEMPPSGERCILPEVFGEVAIMLRYAMQPLPPLPGAEDEALQGAAAAGTAAVPATASPPAAAAAAAQPAATSAASATPSSGQKIGVGDDRGAAAVVDGGGAGSGGDHSALHTPVMYARQGASSKTVRGNPGVCQLLDVGLVPDAYWIVMPQYSCSLAQWRAFPQQQPPSQPQVAALYLAVLIQVAETLQILATDSIVHYDLKAANVLVELLPGATQEQLLAHLPPHPPCLPCFRPVLADFGEARAYDSVGEAFTARNRGTEVYKSPEMLLMHAGGVPSAAASAAQLSAAAASTPSKILAARAISGGAAPEVRSTRAGLASDVWSFGCLAFEVLSGCMLFSGLDYASVTHRVAFGSGPNLVLTTEERASLGETATHTPKISTSGPATIKSSSTSVVSVSSARHGQAPMPAVGPNHGMGRGSNQPQSACEVQEHQSGSASEGCGGLGDFVEWVLARDPACRPSLVDVLARLQELRAHYLSRCE